MAKGSTDGFNNDGWAWGFNNKHRPAGSGTVSQKRREAYRPRQRNREEQNAREIRTPSQPRNDEKARLEKEEKERKEKEEEEALVKRKPGIKEEEQTLAKRKEAIEEEERALAKRKEAIEEEEALHKKKQQEEEEALAKRKEQEEKEALAKRKEQEEEEALAKSAEKDFGPSEKELQKQKMVAKEESWVQVVKKGKKRPSPSPSPNPSSPDWGGSSSSSSPDPCRKDPESAPCQKVYDKVVLKERVPTWVAVDWFRTVEFEDGWWDRAGLQKLVDKGIKVWILSFAGSTTAPSHLKSVAPMARQPP